MRVIHERTVVAAVFAVPGGAVREVIVGRLVIPPLVVVAVIEAVVEAELRLLVVELEVSRAIVEAHRYGLHGLHAAHVARVAAFDNIIYHRVERRVGVAHAGVVDVFNADYLVGLQREDVLRACLHVVDAHLHASAAQRGDGLLHRVNLYSGQHHQLEQVVAVGRRASHLLGG